MRIMLDPGHGGADPGAVSADGRRESDLVLDVARRVGHRLLARSHRIAYTRQSDLATSLAQRTAAANEWPADLLVSIHANAATATEASGYEVWTSPGETGADAVATAIFEAIQRAVPSARGRLDVTDGDPDKEARFYVLIHSAMPAVLVEVGFMSNVAESLLMGLPVWRELMAQAIVAGITGRA